MSDEAIVRTNGRVLFMQGQAGKQVVITSDDDSVSIEHTSTSTKDTWDLSVPEQEVNWGDIGGTLSSQTDLNNKLTDLSEDILDEVEDRENADEALGIRIDGKQDKLTAGDHIEITDDNTINVVGEFGKVYEGVSPVNVDNTNDTISVDHVELNVASPITWDSTTHTIGFNDNGFAKTSDIPTDFYTKSEVDSKDTSLGNRITANEGNISTNTSNISTLDGKMTTVEGDITTINGKFDSYYTKTQIDGFLSNWSGFVVIPLGQELPAASEAQLGKIYLWKKADAQEKDNYEEWISDGTAWSKIGSMEVDLSNYYTKTEVEQNFATLGDITRVEAAVNDKISTVEVDGVTITGNGVDIPLKATADFSDGYTLDGENGINIRDDQNNKKTYIGLTESVSSTINSLGTQVQGLETGLSSKQDKIEREVGVAVTSYEITNNTDSDMIVIVETYYTSFVDNPTDIWSTYRNGSLWHRCLSTTDIMTDVISPNTSMTISYKDINSNDISCNVSVLKIKE